MALQCRVQGEKSFATGDCSTLQFVHVPCTPVQLGGCSSSKGQGRVRDYDGEGEGSREEMGMRRALLLWLSWKSRGATQLRCAQECSSLSLPPSGAGAVWRASLPACLLRAACLPALAPLAPFF